MGNASQRTLGIGAGLFFGVAMGIFSAFTGPELPVALHVVAGVVAGVAFGVLMSRTLVRQRDEFRAHMGDLDDSGKAAAVRAADRGGVPDDPDQAAAAVRVLQYRLDVMARQRRWSLPLFVVVIAISVNRALTSTPWWWVCTVVLLLPLTAAIIQPRYLQRRLDSLHQGPASG